MDFRQQKTPRNLEVLWRPFTRADKLSDQADDLVGHIGSGLSAVLQIQADTSAEHGTDKSTWNETDKCTANNIPIVLQKVMHCLLLFVIKLLDLLYINIV